VAHEAVVAETSRAQQKAKEAAAAVDAVSSAAQQLGAVDSTTNQTLGSLAAAAAALNTIATPKEGAGSAKGHARSEEEHLPSVWDLKGRIEQHKQKVCGLDLSLCPVPYLSRVSMVSVWACMHVICEGLCACVVHLPHICGTALLMVT
jgi:hypothetical protein